MKDYAGDALIIFMLLCEMDLFFLHHYLSYNRIPVHSRIWDNTLCRVIFLDIFFI